MRKALVGLIFFSSLTQAQWVSQGIVVCDTNANAGIYTLPRIAPDGEGGAFICWRDLRNGDYDIYAQRVDSAGRVLWLKNGVAIVQAPSNQDFPRIVSDNRGGAFIAWEDDRSVSNTNVYVQRISSQGQALWQINGVEAALTPGLFISLTTDGVGGVILGWSTVEDVFVQRLDSLGNRVWGDSGVQVTNRPGQVSPGDVAVIGDGSGGGIVAWAEGTYPNYRVYVQRVDSVGTIRWVTNGVTLSDSTGYDVAICSDGRAVVIVKWSYPDGSGRAQRITSSGQTLWQPRGIPLTLSGAGGAQRITSDGRGGAFVGQGLRIHHLDSVGTKVWGDSGVAFIRTVGETNSTQVHDGHQGVFNFTEFIDPGSGRYIQAQWIDSSGLVRFGPDGKHVCAIANGLQFSPSGTIDQRGGAIVCWNDFRRGYSDVYVARVDTNGTVTNEKSREFVFPSVTTLSQNFPNPFNPSTTIKFELSKSSEVRLDVYDLLGREVSELVNERRNAGVYEVKFDGSNFASGVYFYRLKTGDFVQSKKLVLLK